MKDRVIIFDTTLRDGEQALSASLTVKEKLQIALALERLGVDVIEAGFPISSPGDFESVQTIAKTVKNSRICALSRAVDKDIDVAAESLKVAEASGSTPSCLPQPFTFRTNCAVVMIRLSKWELTRLNAPVAIPMMSSSRVKMQGAPQSITCAAW